MISFKKLLIPESFARNTDFLYFAKKFGQVLIRGLLKLKRRQISVPLLKKRTFLGIG
jgi:hypothetical protein